MSHLDAAGIEGLTANQSRSFLPIFAPKGHLSTDEGKHEGAQGPDIVLEPIASFVHQHFGCDVPWSPNLEFRLSSLRTKTDCAPEVCKLDQNAVAAIVADKNVGNLDVAM